MICPNCREVLDCGGPPPLCQRMAFRPKRQRAGAVQNAGAPAATFYNSKPASVSKTEGQIFP
jgi:hypothetical protein